MRKKNRDIKAKKIQKAKAQALSEMAFREPGKIALRLMHVFEGVRNEYQYLSAWGLELLRLRARWEIQKKESCLNFWG